MPSPRLRSHSRIYARSSPLRYVLAFIAPTVEVGHRLLAEGFEGEELSAVRDAWTRAVTVAVTVWAYAYRDHPEQF